MAMPTRANYDPLTDTYRVTVPAEDVRMSQQGSDTQQALNTQQMAMYQAQAAGFSQGALSSMFGVGLSELARVKADQAKVASAYTRDQSPSVSAENLKYEEALLLLL